MITGAAHITASLATGADMSLNVNGGPAVTAKAPGLLARQPQEDFCLGHDNARPVATYSANGPFRGSITALKITTP
jgi:hypothetical protein